MNLNEAIEHCLNKSKECTGPCSIDHFQLAEWLSELRAYRKLAIEFSKFLNLDGINKNNFSDKEIEIINNE